MTIHPGDQVHAYLHGQDITGRVESLDVTEDRDRCSPVLAALVRLTSPAGSLARGELLQVPASALEAVT